MTCRRLILAALSLATLPAFAQTPRAHADVAPLEDFKLLRDITYSTVDGRDLKLDLALPNGPGPYPLVLCIHGGAWRMGDKSKFTPMQEDLARHGYVAASMNYRFAPKYRFPSQLDDTKAALHFLKSNAKQYKIDPARVGATGESAGSHLAMLMSFMAGDKDPNPLTSENVQAIVNYYGPVDLTQWDVTPLVQFLWKERFKESMEQAMLDFLGAKSKASPQVQVASPLQYITKSSPPVLTFHGTLDPVVPFHQAELLHAALEKAGVDQKLVPIPNGLHGAWAPAAKQAADEQARLFFDQYLKGSTTARVIQPHNTGDTASSGNQNPRKEGALH